MFYSPNTKLRDKVGVDAKYSTDVLNVKVRELLFLAENPASVLAAG
jgi:hypothetical protein